MELLGVAYVADSLPTGIANNHKSYSPVKLYSFLGFLPLFLSFPWFITLVIRIIMGRVPVTGGGATVSHIR